MEATNEHDALLGAADIRRIAASVGVKPTKKLGQNFVIDPGTVRRIVREAGVQAGSQVLEVGPGLGSLTLALLETGVRVTCVEIDPVLAGRLPQTVAERMPDAVAAAGDGAAADVTASANDGDAVHAAAADVTAAAAAAATPRFAVVNRDALAFEASDLDGVAGVIDVTKPFTLVANLPYNVATPIVLTLLERFPSMDGFLVMVQDEVADRLAAGPGSKTYGAPSVKLAWYGTAQKAGKVGRNVFWPAPNVDSALVRFTRDGRRDESLRERTFALVEAAFAQRRKTLRAALKGIADVEAIESAGIDPTVRGERLLIDDFAALAAWMEARMGEGGPSAASPSAGDLASADKSATTDAPADKRVPADASDESVESTSADAEAIA